MVSSLISSVAGTLVGTGADWVEIGVGGVTLRVHVPDTAVGNVGRVSERVRLYTSLQVREDSLTLFGFPTDDERQTFETLLNISGIGPRLALAMLGRFSPQALAQTVDSGDTKALSSVPGIGRPHRQPDRAGAEGQARPRFRRRGQSRAGLRLGRRAHRAGIRRQRGARGARQGPVVTESDEDRIRAALEHLSGE